jgi:hypothetical protein
MEKNTLNGFEVFDTFNHNVGGSDHIDKVDDTKIDESFEELTDEELEAIKNSNKPAGKPKKEVESEEEDEVEEEEPVKKSKSKKPAKEEPVEEEEEELDEEDDDVDQEETTQVTAFFNTIAEKLNWEIGEEDEVPQTAEELVEYFQEAIEEASVPTYASDEVAALDEFVKNGGNLRDYFSIDAEIDVEDIDIEDNELNQKAVIKEFLKEKGFNSK